VNDEHIAVGAFALGLLEAEDTAAFEAHLTWCPACNAELAELSPLKALLTGLAAASSGAGVPEIPAAPDLRRRRAASPRRIRPMMAVGAAACLAALGGGFAAGFAVAPQASAPGTAVLVGHLHSAVNARTGVTGTVGLVSRAWGTYVTLDLAGVRGPRECELIAVSKAGQRQVVTGWSVGAPGDGVPGHRAHLLVQGGTAMPLSSLAAFDVIVVNGPTLLSIPV
jgi:Putative zinc-finger